MTKDTRSNNTVELKSLEIVTPATLTDVGSKTATSNMNNCVKPLTHSKDLEPLGPPKRVKEVEQGSVTLLPTKLGSVTKHEIEASRDTAEGSAPSVTGGDDGEITQSIRVIKEEEKKEKETGTCTRLRKE